jgi:NAD+ synthase
MITLYQIAASKNGLVVGTGNKVEDFGVGFYTKYGDGGVDISPIADLYKTEVRELGRHLGIPQEIINAEPTDGLWEDDRTDEDQIGATYEELEWVMELGLNKLSYTQKEYKVVEKFLNFHNKNKHKMVSIPVFDLKEKEII